MPDCTGFLNATASHWLEALARSSWQGGAALLLAWLVSRTAPRLPASMQCWLWRLAWLKLLVALFWVTPVDVPLPMGSALPIARPRGPATPTAHAPLRPAVTAVPTATAAPVEIPSYHPLPSTPPAAPPPLGSAAYLLLAWTACVALLLARMARERNRARALLARCTPTRDTALLTWLEELARKLGMSQRPAVLELEALASPLLIAGRPPVVVLPTALLHSCSEAECRLMLAHELAHVQRRDLAWGWLVAASQVLFFFHPVVWLARRESSLAQEAACDRIAVAVVEAGTATYGELLLKVAAIPNRGFQPGLVPLGGTDQSIHALRRRLKMLQRLQTASRSKRTGEGAWGRSAGLATLVLLGVTIVVPWRVTAQERAVDVSPPATQADAPAPGGSPEGVEPDVPASPDGPEGPNAPALPRTSLASQPVPESTGSDLAAGSLSAAAEQWEDVLLLEAMRYLRLSGDQVAQVRALSRPTDERLSKLRDDEKRTLA
ncbi:MAG: peptidase family protein, partial [Armatimonadetes bacterium]|nr:peptidase family protein [Armatimonadota bacterium]